MVELKMKVTAALVAFTMIAVAFAVVYVDEGSAEDSVVDFSALDVQSNAASTAYGEFNIYIALGSSGWWKFHQEGYNAAIAIDKIGLAGLNLDMNYTINMGGYYDINPAYGQVSMPATINGTAYTYLQIFYYDEGASSWKNASTQTTSLGFYKPFADYELKTANIALYFSTSLNKIMTPAGPYQSLVPLYYNGTTGIIGNPDFLVNFTFTANVDLLNMNYPGRNGDRDFQIEILYLFPREESGYGSDAYLALKQLAISMAIPISAQGNVIDVNMTNNVNTGYGSVQDLLGLMYGDMYSTPPYDHYYYWSLYYDSDFSEYAGWLLGFMSPLAEASELGYDPITLDPPYSYPTPSGTFVVNNFWMEYSYS